MSVEVFIHNYVLLSTVQVSPGGSGMAQAPARVEQVLPVLAKRAGETPPEKPYPEKTTLETPAQKKSLPKDSNP